MIDYSVLGFFWTRHALCPIRNGNGGWGMWLCVPPPSSILRIVSKYQPSVLVVLMLIVARWR